MPKTLKPLYSKKRRKYSGNEIPSDKLFRIKKFTTSYLKAKAGGGSLSFKAQYFRISNNLWPFDTIKNCVPSKPLCSIHHG